MTRIRPIWELTRRMPIQGRIRLGIETTFASGKTGPTSLETFRLTTNDENAIHAAAQAYGGTARPWTDAPSAGQWELITTSTELPIILPKDPLGGTPIYEMWSAAGCARRCDGVTAQVPLGGNEGGFTEKPCLCVEANELGCRPVTRLTVILKDLPFGGGWRLDTRGWNSASELPTMVEQVLSLQDRGLMIAMLAIDRRTQPAAGHAKKYSVPVIRLPYSIQELADGVGQLRAIPAPEQRALTSVAIDEDADVVLDAEVLDLPPASRPLPGATYLRLQEIAAANGETPDNVRHALARRVSRLNTSSTKELDADERAALVALTDEIARGERRWLGIDDNGAARVSRKATT